MAKLFLILWGENLFLTIYPTFPSYLSYIFELECPKLGWQTFFCYHPHVTPVDLPLSMFWHFVHYMQCASNKTSSTNCQLQNYFLTQLHREHLRSQNHGETAKDKHDIIHIYFTVCHGNFQTIMLSMPEEELNFL